MPAGLSRQGRSRSAPVLRIEQGCVFKMRYRPLNLLWAARLRALVWREPFGKLKALSLSNGQARWPTSTKFEDPPSLDPTSGSNQPDAHRTQNVVPTRKKNFRRADTAVLPSK